MMMCFFAIRRPRRITAGVLASAEHFAAAAAAVGVGGPVACPMWRTAQSDWKSAQPPSNDGRETFEVPLLSMPGPPALIITGRRWLSTGDPGARDHLLGQR